MIADFGFFAETFLARIVVGQKWREFIEEPVFEDVTLVAKGRPGALEETL